MEQLLPFVGITILIILPVLLFEIYYLNGVMWEKKIEPKLNELLKLAKRPRRIISYAPRKEEEAKPSLSLVGSNIAKAPDAERLREIHNELNSGY